MPGRAEPDEIAVVPDDIEEIVDRAFYQCVFRGIILPNGLKRIGDHIFQRGLPRECNEYAGGKYVGSKENPYMVMAVAKSQGDGVVEVHPDTRFIDSKVYNAAEQSVNATEIVFGDKLEFIGERAFVYGDFKSLCLPDSVTRIREGAFADCRKLKTAKLPSGLTEIEYMLFSGCESLEKVILPEKLISIGVCAFRDCKSLKKVVIGKNVKAIGDNAFQGCAALPEIKLPTGLEVISSRLFDGCEKLKRVVIPETVTEICSRAFWGCSALEEINIPASVRKIDGCPFNGCTALKKISVDERNEHYFMRGNTLVERSTDRPVWSGADENEPYTAGSGKKKIEFGKHRDNLYIRNLRVDPAVENIDNFAFYRCANMENIEFGDKLKRIGYQAFCKCSALKSVTLPSSFVEGDWYIFEECSSLKTVVFNGALPRKNAGMFDGCTSLEKIVIPSAIEFEGRFLSNCTSLVEITLPADLKEIWHKVFYECTALKRIDIPESVVQIGDNAFNGCTSLEEVNISGDNVMIKAQAFFNCRALKSINIGRGTTIGHSAFVGCDSLKKITLDLDHPLYYEKDECIITKKDDMLVFAPFGKTDFPSGIKKIGAGIFYGESRMTKFTVPDGVEEIVDEAFANTDLEEITLPASLKFISLDAFAYCDKLRKINFKGTRYEWAGVDVDQDSYYHESDEDYFNLVNSTIYSSFTRVFCSDGEADY